MSNLLLKWVGLKSKRTDYRDRIVSEYYSILCFDAYNLSGIVPHLNQTVHGWVSRYTGYYNPYITDGTHPTQEGTEIMANAFMGFFEVIGVIDTLSTPTRSDLED